MKQKLFILLGMLALGLGSTYLYHEGSIRENVLYKETVLRKVDEEAERVRPEAISRTQAINTAYSVFSEGLGVQLLNENIIMYINLYTDPEDDDIYKWFMSWYNELTSDYYSFTINASDGRIISLYSDEMSNEDLVLEEEEQTVSREEFMEAVVPFLKAINISMSQYYVVQENSMDQHEVVEDFKRCIFVNRLDKTDQFVIEIDEQTKRIRSYDHRRVELEEG